MKITEQTSTRELNKITPFHVSREQDQFTMKVKHIRTKKVFQGLTVYDCWVDLPIGTKILKGANSQ